MSLHVKARLIPGWQSLGSEVHYSDRYQDSSSKYQNGNDYPVRQLSAHPGTLKPGFEQMTYHDRYKRGVKFEFTYHGKLGHFDAMAFITRVSSFVVLLGVTMVGVGAGFSLLSIRTIPPRSAP